MAIGVSGRSFSYGSPITTPGAVLVETSAMMVVSVLCNGIGVVQAEFGERGTLDRLHGFRLGIILMVMA